MIGILIVQSLVEIVNLSLEGSTTLVKTHKGKGKLPTNINVHDNFDEEFIMHDEPP